MADDYVFSLKRLMDPKIRSPWTWLLDGKIVGLDQQAAAAKESGNFDYNAKVAGLEAVDRYTLRIRLKQPDYNLSYVLAHEPTSAVAREVVAAYADSGGRMMSNPVGTGPYKLATWTRSSKIVLEANPDYRGFVWDFKAGSDPGDAQLVAEMKGKKMPQVGRIEISIMEEDQSRLLAFQNGELDLMNMEGPLAPKVLDGGEAHAGNAEEGCEAVPLRRPRAVVPLLEHAGSGRRRALEGKDRAAPRDGHGLSGRRGDQGGEERTGGRSAVPHSARCGRSRSRVQVEHQVRRRGRERAARQVRLQEGRGRLAHACPTASRS